METKNGEGTQEPEFFALFKFWYRRKLLFQNHLNYKKAFTWRPIAPLLFNKSLFLDCVENWWIRKSQREYFSYKWVIDRPVNWDSLVAQVVKNPSTMQGTLVLFRSRRSPGEGMSYLLQYSWDSLVSQMIKNPSAMRGTWVRSLGWENPLEKGMATHSSILACRIPMDRGAWQTIQSMGSQRVGHDWVTKHSTEFQYG